MSKIERSEPTADAVGSPLERDVMQRPPQFRVVVAQAAMLELAAYFRRIGDLWEGPDGCGTPGTDLCQRIAQDAYQLARTPMALGLDMVPALPSSFTDAARYGWLRGRPLDAVSDGGVFAGKTPDNVVLNGSDLDAAIDAAMAAAPELVLHNVI